MAVEKDIRIDIVKIQMINDGTIGYGKKQIAGPQDLADLGLKFLKNADREMFVLVSLNSKHYINCIHLVSMGTLNAAIVSPREVMKAALLSNAAAMAFIHNHPSGHPEASQEDIVLTERLATCGELFEIPILDHVIIADNGRYESLMEKGLIKRSSTSPVSWVKENKEEERIICKNCGNVFEIRWLKEGDDYNDFGQRYCPFCGLLTREW